MNGKVLKQLREDAGLRQKDLADRIDTHESTISKIENGSQDPFLSLTERWVRACGRELSVLGPEHDEAIRAIGALSDDQAKLVLHAARVIPTLHQLRVLDLQAMLTTWSQSAGSVETDVKKMSRG